MRHQGKIFSITYILCIIGILLISVGYSSATASVMAATPKDPDVERNTPAPDYDLNKLITQDIPVYCADSNSMLSASQDVMQESQILIGEVREGGLPTGKTIAILSFGHSIERDTGTFFMTIPNIGPNGESMTCILGYGMNWHFFDDEGNQIMKQDSL